ncbi:NUDIX hydrolase [Streptomyces sp. NPDC020875]|uniref:NUDIX hydrolase n=1 Tax=Streptomyces sp. NPDC020875 TaxID=3154898 RepID=UPI0033E3A674
MTAPVVLAIITHESRVLLVRRRLPKGVLLWQFPGGKNERAESAAAAVVRETRAETGLTVVAGPVLGERRHPRTGRTLVYVACAIARGTDPTPRLAAPRDIAATVWAPYDGIDRYVPYGVFAPVRRYLHPASASASARKGG